MNTFMSSMFYRYFQYQYICKEPFIIPPSILDVVKPNVLFGRGITRSICLDLNLPSIHMLFY